jgi:hypothetical protein
MTKNNIAQAPLQKRFQHLFDVIGSARFLNKQGLGNEVPFFICPFNPDEAVAMERTRMQLVNRLEHAGVKVLDINLYDLTIEMLKEREIWDQVLEAEPDVDKAEFMELLQGVLDTKDNLIPAIAEKMREATFNVMFLSGVGEVFPYIRSHNVLNNLQSTAKDQPTVMFFPGRYVHTLEKGASLDLFGRMHDDKYYRAFNIFDYGI